MKGQITKHEWETQISTHINRVHKCKNCLIIRVRQLLFNQPVYYYDRVTDSRSTEEPACINRDPEQQTAYEAQVRRIAEVLARVNEPDIFRVIDHFLSQGQTWVTEEADRATDSYIEQARAMVAEMAKNAEKILCEVESDYRIVTNWLIERGLIALPNNDVK